MAGSRVRQVLAEQDATLTLIQEGVANLHDASLAINEELTTQHALLEGLTRDVDQTTGRVTSDRTRVGRLTQHHKVWRFWVFLVVATILLVFIILY